MARYASRYHRRSNRRSRTLSKVNIAGNRSARAQSRQIAALSRKVNILSRTTRPETLIKFVNFNAAFTNGALSENFKAMALSPFTATYTSDDDVQNANLKGNFNYCKGISLKVLSQYSDNWRDTIADAAHDQNAGYRIVIVQQKIAVPLGQASYTPQIQDVFNTTNTLSSDDTNLTMPLVSGIKSIYKVLYSGVFTLSRYNSTKQHNIYIPARKCLNFIKEVNSSSASSTAKGRVLVFFLTGGLHHDIDYTAQISIAATLKIAYTDN